MIEWLEKNGCEVVAMESTGSFWKPLYNLLELNGITTIVANAQHIKAVPGRKTDVKDAQWIADLLQHGLLKASYIPTCDQRELREISRYRKSLIEERARELNRLQKVLEGGNIKLSSVVRDINGTTSRALLDTILREGVNESNIDENLYGNLRKKRRELLEACNGYLSPLQCRLVRAILDHIDDMTKRIADISGIIDEHMKEYEDAVNRLDEIPGVSRQSAQVILVEIGLDMNRFPTAGHLARWIGVAPGNNESAQKRKSGRTQFRQWATKVLDTFTKQGYVLDKDRLVNGQIFDEDYFDHLVSEIQEIRASERRFYQKITDIYATAVDYSLDSQTTKDFFATVQNKMHYAVHGSTAAEAIMERADHTKEHMGLTSWRSAPDGKIVKADVSIAKNYLSLDEMQELNEIVTMYLDYATRQARRHIPMTMADWASKLDDFLQFNDAEILQDKGKVTAAIAKAFAESEFEQYRIIQDRLYQSDFDRLIASTEN